MLTSPRSPRVLITGASRNIGRAAALAFAQEGARVAISTRSSMDSLRHVRNEIESLGVEVIAARCDVTSPQDVAMHVEEVVGAWGGVDVLVNNAVDRGAEAAFLEQDDDTWDRAMAVNLTGPRNLCRAVIPHMVAEGAGRIINVSGVSAFTGASAAKGMVKLGIVGLTRGIAREFAPFGITANCVVPGSIEVEREAAQVPKPLRAHQPVRRKGTPEEVAAAMTYLASPGAAFVTGQTLHVNGGLVFG